MESIIDFGWSMRSLDGNPQTYLAVYSRMALEYTLMNMYLIWFYMYDILFFI